MSLVQTPRHKMLGASTLSLAIVLPIALTLLIFALDITRIMVMRFVLLNQVEHIGERARLSSALEFQQKDLAESWQTNSQQGFLSSVTLETTKSVYFDDVQSWLENPEEGLETPTENSCCMSLHLSFSTATLTQIFTRKKSWNFDFVRLIYFEGQNTP